MSEARHSYSRALVSHVDTSWIALQCYRNAEMAGYFEVRLVDEPTIIG